MSVRAGAQVTGLGKGRSATAGAVLDLKSASRSAFSTTSSELADMPMPAIQGVTWPSAAAGMATRRSEEHTSELQSLMRISYAVFCLKKKNKIEQKDNKIAEKI